MTRVLLAAPIYDGKKYCWEQWVENMCKIKGGHDLILVDNSPDGKSFEGSIDSGDIFDDFEAAVIYKRMKPLADPRATLAEAQNIIIDYAAKFGYDKVLFIEQDIFPEPDVVNHLLSFNKLVVGNPYFKYSTFHKCDYVVWLELEKMPDGTKSAEVLPLINVYHKMDGSLKRVFNIGVGCCLIDLSVFQTIRFRSVAGNENHSDTYFAEDLFLSGIPFFADTSKLVKHLDTDFNNK